MPIIFADDNQRWDAFREVLSSVRDKLKDFISIGNDETVRGEDLHVVSHVTDIYRRYANGILEVSTICSVLQCISGRTYRCRIINRIAWGSPGLDLNPPTFSPWPDPRCGCVLVSCARLMAGAHQEKILYSTSTVLRATACSSSYT